MYILCLFKQQEMEDDGEKKEEKEMEQNSLAGFTLKWDIVVVVLTS